MSYAKSILEHELKTNKKSLEFYLSKIQYTQEEVDKLRKTTDKIEVQILELVLGLEMLRK